jgi:hypothetical protein
MPFCDAENIMQKKILLLTFYVFEDMKFNLFSTFTTFFHLLKHGCTHMQLPPG